MDYIIGNLKDIFNESITLWISMAPWLLFGFAVAGVLSRVMNANTVARHLGRESIGSTVKAALFGIPLPLCSCGVVPVGLSLYRRGASRSATLSFLAATPQTGVDSIAVTWAFLGPVFAVVRPIAALLNGLLAGILTVLFGPETIPARQNDDASCESGACAIPNAETRSRAGGFVARLAHESAEAFRYAFIDFPREIAGMLVIGILVAGLISWAIPDGFLESNLGSGIIPMLAMAAVGVPMYVCATASVPIAAVLIMKGLSPGAALVFLMTGPATNTASLLLFNKTLGTRTTVIYLVSILVTAFAAGWALDLIAATGWNPVAAMNHSMHSHSEDGMLPRWLSLTTSIALAVITARIILAKAVIRLTDSFQKKAVADGQHEYVIVVDGMACEHCRDAVRKSIQAVEGVRSVDVDLRSGLTSVRGTFSEDAVHKAVEISGFQWHAQA